MKKIKYTVRKHPNTFPSVIWKDKNEFEKRIIINESYSSLSGSFELLADAICKFLNETQPDTIR